MNSPFGAEILKLKGSYALKFAISVPAVMGVIALLGTIAPEETPQWGQLIGSLLLPMFALLLLPMSAATLAALICEVDHRDNQFDHLLSQPVSRISIFGSKFAVVTIGVTLVVALTLVLIFSLPNAAPIFGSDRPVGRLPAGPASWMATRMALAGLCLVVIQTWLAIRVRSFVVVLGIGLMGTMGTLVVAMTGSSWGGWWPWAWPFLATIQADDNSTVAAGLVMGLVLLPLALTELRIKKRSAS